MEECIQHINGSKSLFGFQSKTLSSLILDLVPNPSHQYTKFLKEDFSNMNEEKPFDFLLIVLLTILRKNAGFNIPKVIFSFVHLYYL